MNPKFSHDFGSKNIYAGIGSREIPNNVQLLMRDIGEFMARAGWTLRSGGAPGSDTAFESGCDRLGGTKEIFLARQGHNRIVGPQFCTPTDAAIYVAMQFHPAWGQLSETGKLLHGRNSHIILGRDLNTPVKKLICWTKDGEATGGTGQGIRIAKHNKIEIQNLHDSFVFDQWRRKLDGQPAA